MSKPQGGKREGAGRKPIGGKESKRVSVRLPPIDRQRLLQLGSGAWVRSHLDLGMKLKPTPPLRRGESEIATLVLSVDQHRVWRKFGGAGWLRSLLKETTHEDPQDAQRS